MSKIRKKSLKQKINSKISYDINFTHDSQFPILMRALTQKGDLTCQNYPVLIDAKRPANMCHYQGRGRANLATYTRPRPRNLYKNERTIVYSINVKLFRCCETLISTIRICVSTFLWRTIRERRSGHFQDHFESFAKL